MPHWCRICDQHKANEKFSGKGHRDHICKLCSRRPIAERDAIDQEREIRRYFQQKNISRKNLKRLTSLSKSPNSRIRELAEAILAVGLAKPHKRKRLSFLNRYHPDVMEKLGAVGLIIPPDEYRAMWHNWERYETEAIFHFASESKLFQMEMDKLHLTENESLDPGEINRLLREYFDTVDSET